MTSSLKPSRASATPVLPEETRPMEARAERTLPAAPGLWQYEPKWDGFRCLVFRSAGDVDLRAKSGKPLGRYFPEIVAAVAALDADAFVLDGELLVQTDGQPSFDALQMRLHPAESRIRRLANETPAQFVAFDMLVAAGGGSLIDAPLRQRRAALEAFAAQAGDAGWLRLSPTTDAIDVAEGWLAGAGHGATDGVVAKELDAPYRPGERAMVKVKRLRTADCVVGGFRYGTGGRQVGSLLLGLYDEAGLLNHVGFTSAIAAAERPALTKRLESLREAPGFTGKAPGGPSRWSTERTGDWEPLRTELVAEVGFDHVTGERMRHGASFLRWRPDKDPRQCRMEQILAP